MMRRLSNEKLIDDPFKQSKSSTSVPIATNDFPSVKEGYDSHLPPDRSKILSRKLQVNQQNSSVNLNLDLSNKLRNKNRRTAGVNPGKVKVMNANKPTPSSALENKQCHLGPCAIVIQHHPQLSGVKSKLDHTLVGSFLHSIMKSEITDISCGNFEKVEAPMSSWHLANALIDNPKFKKKFWIAFASMIKVIIR